MAITIASTEFKTRKPKDLDARLVASTGCNAAENLALISGAAVPGRIAMAVAPFITGGAPSTAKLAALVQRELATEGSTLIADIRALFVGADDEGTEVPPTTENGEENGS